MIILSEKDSISERMIYMSAKNIDWSNLGFGYIQTEKRFVAN